MNPRALIHVNAPPVTFGSDIQEMPDFIGFPAVPVRSRRETAARPVCLIISPARQDDFELGGHDVELLAALVADDGKIAAIR
jgi:hypothetical protein